MDAILFLPLKIIWKPRIQQIHLGAVEILCCILSHSLFVLGFAARWFSPINHSHSVVGYVNWCSGLVACANVGNSLILLFSILNIILVSHNIEHSYFY